MKTHFQSLETGGIYASSLLRAQQTAQILFPAFKTDARLKEINYGTLTHSPKKMVDHLRESHIDTPFPSGESYKNVEARLRDFLRDHCHTPLLTIISHQAPQLALEVICHGLSWQYAFKNDWRLQKNGWRPFWIYEVQHPVKEIVQ